MCIPCQAPCRRERASQGFHNKASPDHDVDDVDNFDDDIVDDDVDHDDGNDQDHDF